MDFNSKFSYRRFFGQRVELKEKPYEVIRQFESDRGRIINSAAIRRLQQKTQVFPLERNAAVRSRLTHSLEVQQVGRYIAKEILHGLVERQWLDEIGLKGHEEPFVSIVEMACLLHDVGNPPFGHFGEAALNNWFRHYLGVDAKGILDEKKCSPSCLTLSDSSKELNKCRIRMRIDLSHFDGNAQGIRLVHSLLKLNLTYAQIACVLKYTRPAYWEGELPDGFDYLMKKPGYYLSEDPFIQDLRQVLDMKEFHRFPLSYIMEAADDISYCVADLEDAVEKKILTVKQLLEYLAAAWGAEEKEDLFTATVKKAYSRYEEECSAGSADNLFFMYLRVHVINKLVPYVAQRFIKQLPQIYAGSFNQALLEGADQENRLLKIFKKVACQHVFNHPEVEQLELQGDRIIRGLLDIYSCLLAMPMEDFNQLVKDDVHDSYPIETRLFHKLPAKHRVAYQEAVNAAPKSTTEKSTIWEYYYRVRLIQDYISGMTDLYAYDEYRRLMAAE